MTLELPGVWPGAQPTDLIGTRWVRRTPRGDGMDTVDVTGIFDAGRHGLELVVRPVEFGPTVSATADSFTDVYRREDGVDDSAMDSVRDRLAQLGSA